MCNNGSLRKEQRRTAARARGAARAQRSARQQLTRLRRRGQGHCAEVGRLTAQIAGAGGERHA